MVKVKMSCYNSKDDIKKVHEILVDTCSRIIKTRKYAYEIVIHFYAQDWCHLDDIIKRASNETVHGILILKAH